MQTKTYNVYTFDELDEKAKEKAREWYRDGNEYYFLSENMTEYAGALLKWLKIDTFDFKVYYSLSYSQGDGAMVEIKGTWKSYNVTVKQSGPYYHYNSKTIALESTKTGKDASSKVYEQFNDIYVELCKKLTQYGYTLIEYENSNDSVDEMITCNEYMFLVDGTRHD